MNKLLFFIKRPSIVLVIGKGGSFAFKNISQILKNKKVLVFDTDLSDFFLKKSKLPILVINYIDSRKEIAKVKNIAKIMPYQGYLVLNSDNKENREIKDLSDAHCFTYGFQKRADLQVTDVNVDENGTNFKINYQGNIVPFWFREYLKRKHIYSILSAIAVGIIHNMNLVEISQSLK